MEHIQTFIVVFALALASSLLLAPGAIWIARRFDITAKYGGRHTTEGDKRRVPKLGGLVLYGAFVCAVLAAQALPVPRHDPYETIRLIGLLLGATVIFIFGVIDDILDLKPLPQFIGQFLAASIAILFQIFIEYFNNPFTGEQTAPWPFFVTVAISLFWMMFTMNTVNWLDGLDGLASGVAFIAGVMLFINSAFRVEPAQTSVSLLHLALMGATLGFLLFNFNPARIFLGGGAPLLGYLLGTLSIIGGAKMATILLVMGLPLLDATWQIFNRLRKGKLPFTGDRGHLHFRLLDQGFSQRQIVLGYYLFCTLFGILTLVTSSRMFKFIALSVMGLIILGGFLLLARVTQERSSTSS